MDEEAAALYRRNILRLKKVLPLVVCFSLLASDVVFATETSGAEESTTAAETTAAQTQAASSGADPYATSTATDAFTVALNQWLERSVSEAERFAFSSMICAFRADGLPDNAICGILGNVKAECSGYLYVVEGYWGGTATNVKTNESKKGYNWFRLGNEYTFGEEEPAGTGSKVEKGEGVGFVGWSFGWNCALTDFANANESKYGKVVVTHKAWHANDSNVQLAGHENCHKSGWATETDSIPGPSGQAAFILLDLHGENVGQWADSDLRDVLVSASSPTDAAKAFQSKYERNAGGLQERGNYAEAAMQMVQACTGVVGVDPVDGSTSGGAGNAALAVDMEQHGYWKESELSAWSKLSEINVDDLIDDLSRDMLNQNDLNGLAQWERNVQNDIDSNGLIPLLRRVITFVGILLMVWMVVWYLAYWFDRTVTFVYIDLLGIVSFGMLHMAAEGEESTFGLGKEGRKTVNHKTILVICLTGIAFGTLLVTGVFYRIIGLLVQWMKRLLRWIGGIF